MKNKKGFTLIELLVTITLMLSILGIAIVSFINISNRKKEESWKKVKEQTEQAAEEYYKINEYYLESLTTEGGYARISIGKLVEEDFLTKTVNPLNGKTLNSCDYVEVTKNTSGYLYKYVENNDNSTCNVGNYLVVSKPGAPLVSVTLTKAPTGKNAYYINDVEIKATVSTNGNGPIKEVKYCSTASDSINCKDYKNLIVKSGKENDYYGTNYSINNNSSGVDGNKVTTIFTATNASGNTISGEVTYKKDTENPVCGKNNGTTSWAKDKRTINQKCTDKTSGCAKDNYSIAFTSTTRVGTIKIEDKAGNTNNCSANVYVDADAPTCGSVTGQGSTSNWTNTTRNITQACLDGNGSGCSSVSKTFDKEATTGTITVKDGVGHSTNCTVGVYIDKTNPTCSITFSGTAGSNGWYIIDDVNVSLSKSDRDSKVANSGIGTYGLTTTANASYNNKTSGTQSSETSSTKWYGYVKDKAGNAASCNKTVKLEKNVTMSFNTTETNKVTSYNYDEEKEKKLGSSHGKPVFDTSKGACGFGTCNNIKCKTNSSKTTSCPKTYFARSCMYVNTYDRWFTISSVSSGTINVKVDGKTSSTGMKKVEKLSRYGGSTIFNSNYYYELVGNSSGSRTSFTAHQYQYTTPAGLKSDKIRLYIEYVADCGYYYY